MGVFQIRNTKTNQFEVYNDSDYDAVVATGNYETADPSGTAPGKPLTGAVTPEAASTPDTDLELKRNQEALRKETYRVTSEKAADRGSFVGAMGGTGLGLALAPETGGASLAIPLIGSALGAGGGRFLGYNSAEEAAKAGTYGAEFKDIATESPLSGKYKMSRAVDSALWDAAVNAGTLGAGKLYQKTILKAAGIDPAAVMGDVTAAASQGINLSARDVATRGWVDTYLKVISIAPLLGGPARKAGRQRVAEASAAIEGLVGPMESGLSTATLGRDWSKLVNDKWSFMKDTYNKLFKDAEGLAMSDPNVRFPTTSISPAQPGIKDATGEYLAKQQRGAVTLERTTSRTVATKRTSDVAAQTQPGTVEFRRSQGTKEVQTPEGLKVSDLPETTTKTVKASDVQRVSEGTVTTERTTTDPARAFEGPTDVEKFIQEVNQYPDQLDYFQIEKLGKQITRAMYKADGEQKVVLAKMRNAFEASLDNSTNPILGQTLKDARVTYANAVEFFEKPQAAKFKLADPDLPGASDLASRQRDQVYETIMKDISPDGLADLEKFVGNSEMNRASRLYLKTRYNQAEGDLGAFRRSLGLHDPTSMQYAVTDAMAKRGEWPVKSAEEMGKALELIEKSISNELPEIATQLVRGASLGGINSFVRNITLSRVSGAIPGEGIVSNTVHKAGSFGLAVMSRNLTKNLTSPVRFKIMMGLANPSTPIRLRKAFTNQALRYAAEDIALGIGIDQSDARNPVTATTGAVRGTLAFEAKVEQAYQYLKRGLKDITGYEIGGAGIPDEEQPQ